MTLSSFEGLDKVGTRTSLSSTPPHRLHLLYNASHAFFSSSRLSFHFPPSLSTVASPFESNRDSNQQLSRLEVSRNRSFVTTSARPRSTSFLLRSRGENACQRRETGLDSHVDRPLFLLLLLPFLLPLLLLLPLLAFYVPPLAARSFRSVISFSSNPVHPAVQSCFSFFSSRRPSFSSVPYGGRRSNSSGIRGSVIYPPMCLGIDSASREMRVEILHSVRGYERRRDDDGHEIEQNGRKRKKEIVQLTDRTYPNGVIIYYRPSFFS